MKLRKIKTKRYSVQFRDEIDEENYLDNNTVSKTVQGLFLAICCVIFMVVVMIIVM